MSGHPHTPRLPVAVTLAAVAAGTLLTACAHTAIQGAATPPDTWVSSSSACEQIAGTYSELGVAAPANSTAWLYMVVWPNIGSLVSFAERGMNGVPAFPPRASVRIDVDASGRPTFRAFDTAGNEESVKAREWWCEGGALVTRAPLNPSRYAKEHYQESMTRLWRASDGALIAEETFREVRRHWLDSSTSHEPFARFYFRFPVYTGRNS